MEASWTISHLPPPRERSTSSVWPVDVLSGQVSVPRAAGAMPPAALTPCRCADAKRPGYIVKYITGSPMVAIDDIWNNKASAADAFAEAVRAAQPLMQGRWDQ